MVNKWFSNPGLRFAAAVYNLVTDRRFELAIMVAILLNMVVMAIESHDANDQAIFVLEQLNNVFVGCCITKTF